MKRRSPRRASERAVRSLLILAVAVAAAAQDAREIVRRSIEKDQTNRSLRRQYTYIQKSSETQFEKDGKVKSSTNTVREVLNLYGHPFNKLIEKNGKPLTSAEEQKEKERLEKFTARWANESEDDRRKRQEHAKQNRLKQQAFMREIADAYDFKIVGEEKIAGQDAWIIQAEPHPGFKAKTPEGKYLAKIHGKVWIDKAQYQWVKADAETIDTISYGLVLLRLYKGSRLQFEQTRVNDEIWLPKMERVTAGGRLGLFVRASLDQTTTYENYRKFQTNSKLVLAEDP